MRFGLPAQWHWDHNQRYHRWLLRRVPAGAERALDAGCGAGDLARRLAERGARVDAMDASAEMIERARAGGGAGVRWLCGDVLALPLAEGYDVVTAVASLHHLPLRAGLARLAGAVRPGGVLVVIGLHRPASVADHVVGVIALPANFALGAWHAARGSAGKPDDAMPTMPPMTTIVEIRAVAAELLPGYRLRRRLFWRYSLVWHRPVGPPPGA